MFVRFESIQKPNSYNDSPITSLSFMRHDVSLESEAQHSSSSSHNAAAVPDLQSPTTMHHHHFGDPEAPEADLNNNNNNDNDNNNSRPSALYQHAQNQQQLHQHHHQHNHHNPNLSTHSHRSFDSDNVSVVEDDSAKERFAKDGWLAVGNARGIVGVSFTTTKSFDYAKNWCHSAADSTVNAESASLGAGQLSQSGSSDHHPSSRLGGTVPSALPARTNYNLRGHRAEILFVRWNEPFQKLATCDENGVIFIWIQYEGRWSIELINDRNTRVTDIAWSHDGRMALICYLDGFVLVGSVSGQRYWSSMLNLADTTITCGVWSPTDQQVLFGTSNGHLLVISVHGTFVTQVAVQDGLAITGLAWSCAKFHSSARGGNVSSCSNGSLDSSTMGDQQQQQQHRLAVSFLDGTVFVMRNYDDLDPKIISTDCSGVRVDWSSDGQVLAVGGHRVLRSDHSINGFTYNNVLNLYSRTVFEQHRPPPAFPIPPARSEVLSYDAQPLSAITWGNADRRLYIACGQVLYVGWVFQNIPTLSFLARLKIHRHLKVESKVATVPVPEPLKCSLSELFTPSLCCYLPDYQRIREFVFRPPPTRTRLHCTLMRHEVEVEAAVGKLENGSTSSRATAAAATGENSVYVLYLEYMGGLVPILKGKRSSKLKTEFFIYDPEVSREAVIPLCKPPGLAKATLLNSKLPSGRSSSASATLGKVDPADSNDDDVAKSSSLSFPYLTPKTRRRLRSRSAQFRRYLGRHQDSAAGQGAQPADEGALQRATNKPNCSSSTPDVPVSLPCPSSSVVNDLPEQSKIVYIASNIWGTKFKFIGLSSMLPTDLGTMRYRTSFLHLQPRQMSLHIKELNHNNTSTVLSSDDCRQQTDYGACDGSMKQQLYGSNSCLVSSDSEDEYSDYGGNCSSRNKQGTSCTNTPAIVPLTPFKSVRNSMFFSVGQPANQAADTTDPQLDSHLVQQPDTTTIEVKHLDQPGQSQKPFPKPICLKDAARVREECQSIISRFANMNEELLTLQINQNEGGKPVYSIELTTGAHNLRSQQKTSREPEYYVSPDESPFDSVTPSTLFGSALPTMVRQFKHQSFQSESPKHVSYLRHQSVKKGAVTNKKSGSPNISPSKSIRQKILKESPRKSSVSYCSTEFSALSTQSYIEEADEEASSHHTSNSICDKTATVPSVTGANGLSFPIKSAKMKSCSSEAYSSSHLHTSNPPLSYSVESSAVGADLPELQQAQCPVSFASPFSKTNQNSLYDNDFHTQNIDFFKQTNAHKKISTSNCNHQSMTSESEVGTMQTYHIYDDTDRFNRLNLLENDTKKVINDGPPATPVHRRRKQFAQNANKNSSKSFESPLKTACSLVTESNLELEENHLDNVEKVVKLLSEKLSKAAKEKESQQQITESLTYSSKPTFTQQSSLKQLIMKDHNLKPNNRSNSLTFGSPKMPHQNTNITISTMQKTAFIQSNNNLEFLQNAPRTPVNQTKMISTRTWKNQSLPASPFKMIKSFKNSITQKTANNNMIDVTIEKRHSDGRHFFYSPKVMRKMRKKLNYLDCSSEEDSSSDEEEIITFSSTTSSACQTPINLTPKLPRRMIKSKIKNKFNEIKTQEFTLHNKAPLWNEITQVYQLDFGGRVTQESAKNFQIEHEGQQVMQFGRIEKNAYTLDFEYPFSAVQALSVALANITQRFK